MKKAIKILGIVLVILIVLLTSTFFIIKSWKIPEVEVVDVDLSNITDGSYTGEYSTGPVKAVVKVKVREHRIVEIMIDQHQNGLGKKAEKIVNDIINEQSINVDVIAGATLSGNVIRKAVEEALNKVGQ